MSMSAFATQDGHN